jgi:Domain of unknown function (DUF1707)/Domain of unknown function (DUF4190)
MTIVRGGGMRLIQTARYGSLRAGDADRERVIDVLRAAHADGRIDLEEFGVRTDDVLHALTFAELERVTADLPGGSSVVRFRPGGLVRPPRSGLAVASAALGLGGWLGPTFLAWIPAIVVGHRARRDIERDGTDGRDLTTIGLAAAYAGLVLQVLCVLALLAVVVLS